MLVLNSLQKPFLRELKSEDAARLVAEACEMHGCTSNLRENSYLSKIRERKGKGFHEVSMSDSLCFAEVAGGRIELIFECHVTSRKGHLTQKRRVFNLCVAGKSSRQTT